MTKVELTVSKRYQIAGKLYEAGKVYAVTDELADHLLAQRSERDVPYFRIVAGGEEEAAPAPKPKRAAAKKAAPKKKAAKKKAAAKPSSDDDGGEPTVSV